MYFHVSIWMHGPRHTHDEHRGGCQTINLHVQYIYKQMSLTPSLLDWDESVIDLITSAWLTG